MQPEGLIYIAVVDDDESVRRSYGRWLRAAGFLPVAYPSAEAFLEDRRHPLFQCLVLDIRLPGMSGLELGRRLAAVNDRTPVIYLAAHDEPAIRQEAQASGCVAFFRKTDEGSRVLDAIRRATGQHSRGPDPQPCSQATPG